MTRRQGAAMIEAVGLKKHFRDGTKAVDGVDFRIGKGEVFGLLGPNGAGKTTTINLFLDFIRPTAGKALVNGVEVAAEPRVAKHYLELIPENVALYPTLTAVQNVEFFSSVGVSEAPRRDLVGRALLQVGLEKRDMNRRVSGFSKGMRQKTGLAVALVRKAPAVLLDEPTSGLDPKAAADLLGLLDVMREDGAAILMCTHDIFRAQQLCDRIGIMRNGRMEATLDRREIAAADLERVYLDVMVRA